MPLYNIGYIDANNPSGISISHGSLASFKPMASDLYPLTLDDDNGFLQLQGGGDATPGSDGSVDHIGLHAFQSAEKPSIKRSGHTPCH